ncbi:MAG TPA: universal stress protein [Leptolyngbyaceae cyanobacterium M33_DOE_097]|uniref:Universal stress protein n=1 Tax=Oscillatoriales cyanobacterium SpSt-418 TaxID=2282169 RepID=A0A7C3PKJ9_9CYAN|nr:universal stress protein [Leptolyngbyaceae cyanobacterium M33_DOE_097]
MFSKILVALDSSGVSRNVFAESVSLAKQNNARLMLVHVLSPVDDGYPSPIYPGADSLYTSLHTEAVKAYARQWEIFEREGLELLKSLANQAIAAGVETEFTQNVGDPGEVVCRIAESWNADLIVVGRRGRTGLAELFLGSVSNYVLHHARCSVLTIQGHIHEPEATSAEKDLAAAQ